MLLENLFGFGRRGSSVGVAVRDLDYPKWIAKIIGASNTKAGIAVTPQVAEKYSAVYTCVRIISETIATCPVSLIENLDGPDGKKRRREASNHRLHHLLHVRPNRFQTPMIFKEMITGHACLRGNGYAEILHTPTNPTAELIPLHPDRVEPFITDDEEIAYRYNPMKGPQRIILREEMFHLRGPGGNMLQGSTPIKCASESFGIALAGEQFAAGFFKRGAHMAGVLKYKGNLEDDELDKIKESTIKQFTGVDAQHNIPILEEDMEWQNIGMSAEDAQLLETRKYGKADIGGMFRVPVHMMNLMEKATFRNVEHLAIEFLRYTLSPWIVRWVEALNGDLMFPVTAARYYFRFNVESLMRGDTQSRYESYGKAIGNGVMTPNEARGKEDLEPTEDESGDMLFIPSTLQPLKFAAEKPEPAPVPGQKENPNDIPDA